MKRMIFGVVAFVFLLTIQSLGSVEYFVSTGGDDSYVGSRDKPFATLERARDAVRGNGNSGPVTVWVRGGTYYPDRALELGGQDSGTSESPVVYRACEGEEVRISGGRSVGSFKSVSDAKILGRLEASVRDRVVYADLKGAGISDFGHPTAINRRAELFFDDEPTQLSRWPNEGFVKIVDAIGETSFVVHGRKGTREGKLVYSDKRPERWVGEEDVWLHGYWFWDWSDSFEKVDSIDIDKQLFTTAAPYHNYGYRKGQRYYAINVLAELDKPGEWYLDREAGRLYFLPPKPNEPTGGKRAIFSVLGGLINLKDCSWVTIRDVIIENTRSTAVTISGGSGNNVAGCVIRNTGSYAVRVSGGRENSVIGCDIYNTGEGGISLNGGDRKTLAAAGHLAENNHIHHFGRIYRTYRPAIMIGGVGNRIRHNVIHEGPHNAIQLGGNDHLIEFNEIYRVCFETGDVGAFYMGRDWTARGTVIRHNYFHDIKGPGLHGAMAVYLDDSASGISIVGNVFCRAGRAAFIGGGRDNLVANNIFVDCAASVHVDARGVGWMSYHVGPGGTLPTRLAAMPYKQSPWKGKYPQLVNILKDEPGLPKGNIVRNNISFGGKWLDVESKAMPLIKFENNLADRDPHFVDAANSDFRLRADSPAYKMGFKKIPIEKIGLYKDTIRRNAGK